LSNRELDPSLLKSKIDKGEDLVILDVRTEEEYKSWKISYDRYNKPKLIPVNQLFSSNPEEIKKYISKDKEIITICAHGQRSLMAANLLEQLGYNVKSVKNGMAGWNKVYDTAEIPTSSQRLKIFQIRRISKGCIGYIIFTDKSKNAVILDPPCQISNSFMEFVRENELKVLAVIDTHIHADHISAAPSISKELGCLFVTGESYVLENEFLKVKSIPNGQEIVLEDNIKLKAVQTPGHTPGSVSYLLKTMNQQFLFTGDTLFLDGIGRPDLHNKVTEFATDLFHTYHNIISNLDPATIVLPSHYNVESVNVKHTVPLMEPLYKIKEKLNLLPQEKQKFIDFIISKTPPQPPNYRNILSRNQKQQFCEDVNIGDLEAGPNSCSIM
jgi:glyoxylase-like metal-dependent hydrolase (beta-lactamase superfamily II)/rhodanese-related sulfurtransferase